MEQWLFLRVTADDGTGWRWERHDGNGRIVEAATSTYTDYAEALGDAMQHGYLSDVKTLP